MERKVQGGWIWKEIIGEESKYMQQLNISREFFMWVNRMYLGNVMIGKGILLRLIIGLREWSRK